VKIGIFGIVLALNFTMRLALVKILSIALFAFPLFGKAEKTRWQFPFYGKTVTVNIPNELIDFSFPENNFDYILVSRNLNEIHKLKLNETIDELRQQSKDFSLDNIGYFQLLKYFSASCFPKQTNNFRKAIVWYGLRQGGVDAVLGGNTAYFNLFVRMENSPDGGFAITHQGKKYVSASVDKIQYASLEIYRLQLMQDSAAEALQLDMYNTPLLGHTIKSKTRTFSYGNQTFTLNTKYNSDVVNYLNDLPSFRIGSYLYTLAPSEEAQKSMDDSLEIWLKNKTYGEKLTFILALVQNAFPYKADADYRKSEKRNFVEQTMADEYIDCEDKAALFCYLVNKYLGAETVMLYSKSATHVCCAIELPEKAPGFTFKYFGKPYLVCEPAFEGLKPGETELTKDEIMHLEVFN